MNQEPARKPYPPTPGFALLAGLADGGQPHLINVQFHKKMTIVEIAFHLDFNADEVRKVLFENRVRALCFIIPAGRSYRNR